MRVELTEVEEDIALTAAKFAQKEVAPLGGEVDAGDRIPPALFELMAGLDYLGLCVPAKYGGVGLGLVARTLILAEISQRLPAVGFALQVFQLAISPIVRWGTEEQRGKYVPPMASGKSFGTMTLTEPSGGSDPRGIKTRAEKDGGIYRLSGAKCFITHSRLADIHIVLARTGAGVDDLSAFIVESSMPGFKVGRLEEKRSLRGCEYGEVIFDGCQVPAENRLGEEGEGLRIVMEAVSEYGRSGVSAVGLGIISGCLQVATEFARERVVGGKPIIEYRQIKEHVQEIEKICRGALEFLLVACRMVDEGGRADRELALAKKECSEGAFRSAGLAGEVLGGAAICEDFPVARYLRDSAALFAAAGTNEIMELIIGKKE